ncbi:transposase IstA domain protein [Mycobacterium kansasii 824]|nr:transposase IstA domain protein [Mycobacterium kansasii 824]
MRARPSPDPFDPFVDYVTARLTEDPHLWAPPSTTSWRSSASGCRIRA